MSTLAEFRAIYKSQLGGTITKDEEFYWNEFLQRSEYETLLEVVSELSERFVNQEQAIGRRPMAPSLGLIKRRYFNRRQYQRTGSSRAACSNCDGSGWVLCAATDGGRVMGLANRVDPLVGAVAAPCSCPNGSSQESPARRQTHAQNSFGPASGSMERYREWAEDRHIEMQEREA